MYGRHALVGIAGQELLTRVDSFGKLGITSLASAFYKCTGLASVPKTVPDSVTDMFAMFRGCSGAAFNPDVSNWDVSKVTNMSNMFRDCSGAAFNPDVSNWDVSKVTNMSNMFYNCSGAAFNPVVSNWNVSKVTDMYQMFRGCSGDAFNPDVSNWNVSKVTDMTRMFYNCYGDAFNPDMKRWTLKTGVATAAMFLWSKIQPPTWLDNLLVEWAANTAQGNNITIDFSPNKFTVDSGDPLPAVADALTTLEGKGWTIATANPYSST
jgi:surface protein